MARMPVPKRGEVREWLNRAVSKTVEPSRVPWVRIPPSPPENKELSSIGAQGEMVAVSALCKCRANGRVILASSLLSSPVAF